MKSKGGRGRVYEHDDEVTKPKKWRTPTYDEHMKKRQVTADIPLRKGQDRMKEGPVVDTAASISVVTAKDKKYLTQVKPLPRPEMIKSAGGTVAVQEAGALQVGAVTLPKVVHVPQSPVSVVAMQDLAVQD